MKMKIFISLAFLSVLVYPVLRAQEASNAQGPPSTEQHSLLFCPGTPDDPRLTPEQRNILLKAGEDNPQHPGNVSADSKLTGKEIPDEKYYGEANAKPSSGIEVMIQRDIEERDRTNHERLLLELNPPPVLPDKDPKHVQPAGAKAKDVINYRNVKGPDEQPKPILQVTSTNLRESNGPNDQPKGPEPKK